MQDGLHSELRKCMNGYNLANLTDVELNLDIAVDESHLHHIFRALIV